MVGQSRRGLEAKQLRLLQKIEATSLWGPEELAGDFEHGEGQPSVVACMASIECEEPASAALFEARAELLRLLRADRERRLHRLKELSPAFVADGKWPANMTTYFPAELPGEDKERSTSLQTNDLTREELLLAQRKLQGVFDAQDTRPVSRDSARLRKKMDDLIRESEAEAEAALRTAAAQAVPTLEPGVEPLQGFFPGSGANDCVLVHSGRVSVFSSLSAPHEHASPAGSPAWQQPRPQSTRASAASSSASPRPSKPPSPSPSPPASDLPTPEPLQSPERLPTPIAAEVRSPWANADLAPSRIDPAAELTPLRPVSGRALRPVEAPTAAYRYPMPHCVVLPASPSVDSLAASGSPARAAAAALSAASAASPKAPPGSRYVINLPLDSPEGEPQSPNGSSLTVSGETPEEHREARREFILAMQNLSQRNATSKPLPPEVRQELERIQVVWADLTWANPESSLPIESPGKGTIMARRRDVASDGGEKSLVDTEMWARVDLEKEERLKRGAFYRKLLELLL